MNGLADQSVATRFTARISANLLGLIALAVMSVAAMATIVWGLDRGLGLGDEGVYLLSARYPEDIRQNVSAIYNYTGFIFKLVNYSPQFFRLAGLVLLVLSSVVFWLGMYQLLTGMVEKSRLKLARWYSLAFIIIGALLYYQWFFPTPNNYTLNSVALNFFAGALLLGLSFLGVRGSFSRMAFISLAISGAALGAAFFIKVSSGFCLLIIACFVLSCWKCDGLAKVKAFASFFAGVAAWLLLHFGLVLSPNDSWLMFKDGWALYQAFGVHVPGIKIFLYLNEIILLLYSALMFFWPCHLLLVISRILRPVLCRGKAYKASYDASVVILAVFIAISLTAAHGIGGINQPALVGGIPGYILFALAWALLLVVATLYFASVNGLKFAISNYKFYGNHVVVVLALLGMPVAAAIGTANPIYNVVSFYSVPWFGAIFVLLIFAEKNMTQGRPWITQSCLLVVGLFTAIQIINGYVYNPQQIPTDVRQQNVETVVGFPEQVLKLDAQTSGLINKLAAIAKEHGFEKGDDIIAISYLPSLVYALGGRSPGHPAFLTGSEASLNYSRMALQFADMDRVKASLVLINSDELAAASILSSRGLDFPAAYENVGTVEYTSAYGAKDIFSLWKPRG